MKYIITEEQYNNLSVKRKLYVIDELINIRMKQIYKGGNFYVDYCDYGSDTFIDIIIEWVVERMYYDYFGEMDDNSEEWANIYRMIIEYIKKIHSNKIIEQYNKMCDRN